MEAKVLRRLSFEVTVPTVHTFLSRFAHCASLSAQEKMMCKVRACINNLNPQIFLVAHAIILQYLAELCMLDINCVDQKPSLVAASVLYVARKTLQEFNDPTPVWVRRLKCNCVTNAYTKQQLFETINSNLTILTGQDS